MADPTDAVADDPDDLGGQLAGVLASALGSTVIRDLVRLTGGASRETWSFDAHAEDGTITPLILQRQRGSTTLDGPSFGTEDRLLAAAAAAGVPVADVVADSAVCTALGEARVTRRIDGGETLGPRIVRSERFQHVRSVLTERCGAALAAIHSIPVDRFGDLTSGDPLDRLREGLDLLGVVSPAFELALRWLGEHRPASVAETVVHGDFRIGNLLVDDTDLRAVLDWELSHRGDPVEDLGWLCVRAWRFGGPGIVGGVGAAPDLLAAYRAAGGIAVDPEHLRWWIVAGTLRWGLICAVQAQRHLDGQVVSVELATIGRRIAENEHDLLELLGVPEVADDELPAVVDHGRPTAGELLAAVRQHLSDQVGPMLAPGDAFTLRVAANALAMVERELGSTPKAVPTVDEPALAARIRSGGVVTDLDRAAIRGAVTVRVRAANPRWT